MSFFGAPKVPKTENIPDTKPYVIYFPHSKPYSARRWNQGYYQFASIDPAKENYALRIERRWNNGKIEGVAFEKVCVLAEETKEGVNAPLGAAGNVKTIVDFTEQTNGINIVYDNVTKFLDKYRQLYFDCHYIVVEQQLSVNYKTNRIAQHTLSYFMFTLRDAPLLPAIVEVSARLKTVLLGAPKHLNYNGRKQWCVAYAARLLARRGDTWSLAILNQASKKDDYGDTVCQIEALCALLDLPLTPEVPEDTSFIPTQVTPLRSRLIIEDESRELDTMSQLPLTRSAPAPITAGGVVLPSAVINELRAKQKSNTLARPRLIVTD